jgi:hypothetical protein
MNKKVIYSFKDTTSTGLDIIPVNSLILIEDYDGNGTPKQILLSDKTGITGTTTIGDLLTTLANLWSNSVSSESNYLTKTTAYTALAGDYIYASTTGGAFTITLPATPNAQDIVTILDNTSNFATANLTVARNGETIMGLAEDILLNVDSKEYKFIYNGTDWRVTQ